MDRGHEWQRQVDDVIKSNAYGVVQAYDKVDLSAKIPNTDDRRFVNSVIQAIFELEPRNPKLIIDLSTKLRTTILVWAECLRGPIDLNYYGKIMQLPHPVPGFTGISNTGIGVEPPTAGNPERFVVQVNSCAQVAKAADLSRLLDRPKSRRGREPERRSRSRSRSPRVSRSPSPDRSPSHRPSRPRRSHSSSSSDEGLLSRIGSTVFSPFL